MGTERQVSLETWKALRRAEKNVFSLVSEDKPAIIICAWPGKAAAEALALYSTLESALERNQVRARVEVMRIEGSRLNGLEPLVMMLPAKVTYIKVGQDDVDEIVRTGLRDGKLLRRLLPKADEREQSRRITLDELQALALEYELASPSGSPEAAMPETGEQTAADEKEQPASDAKPVVRNDSNMPEEAEFLTVSDLFSKYSESESAEIASGPESVAPAELNEIESEPLPISEAQLIGTEAGSEPEPAETVSDSESVVKAASDDAAYESASAGFESGERLREPEPEAAADDYPEHTGDAVAFTPEVSAAPQTETDDEAVRKGKTWCRTQLRKISAEFFFLLFLTLLVLTLLGKKIPILPNNFFSLIDPYQALMTLLAKHEPVTRYWPSLITIGLTVAFGRVWCGWICPLGTILGGYGPSGRPKGGKNWRRLKTILLFVLGIFAFLGSLAFVWLDPVAMLIQPVLLLFKPASEFISQGTLDAFRFVGRLWWLSALPAGVAILLNFFEKQFWCRYLCPSGALQGLLSKFSFRKRHVDQTTCVACDACTRACPVGAIDRDDEFRSDPGECTMCLECAHVCPAGAIAFQGEEVFQAGNEFDPGRREFFGTAALIGAVFGLSALQRQVVATPEKNPLRPPGSVRAGETLPETFLQSCIRCSQCVLACPRDILKPAILESGLSGIGTPVVEFGNGYCAPDCNRCSQVCPSGAIPTFSIAEKSAAKIGVAHVYYPECTRCGRCVEACPYQAFEEVRVEGRIYPQAQPERCNGCGICLVVCPVFDRGAIQVYPPTEVPDDGAFAVTKVS